MKAMPIGLIIAPACLPEKADVSKSNVTVAVTFAPTPEEH
jgi:hypothetical protein